jgi:hypothetical protein
MMVSCNATMKKITTPRVDYLMRFENKNIFMHFETRSILLQRWRCSCKFRSRRIGSRICSHCYLKHAHHSLRVDGEVGVRVDGDTEEPRVGLQNKDAYGARQAERRLAFWTLSV